MKKNLSLIIMIISVFVTGCFAPINLTYDSAKTLDKGQVQVRAMYSRYNVYETKGDTATYNGLINQNYGISIGYGISDKYTMSVRYEYLKPTITFQKAFGDINSDFDGMNSISYFEIDNKISLVKDKLTISLPLGGYFYNTKLLNNNKGGMGWFSFDPRLYWTLFRSSKVFDLSVVPKVHILFGSFSGVFLPGISVGAGFSSDLDKWAIRPEIGYDSYLSFGVGANVNFGSKKAADNK